MRQARNRQRPRRGFTMIEMMITVAIAALLLTIAAPSFRDMVQKQRLRATNAQFITDVQFARSEAASRQRPVYIWFRAGQAGMSCYSLNVCPTSAVCNCNCTAAPGARCAGEIRTVQVPDSLGLRISPTTLTPGLLPPIGMSLDPATGGMIVFNFNPFAPGLPANSDMLVDVSRLDVANAPRLRTIVSVSGRPSECSPSGAVSGVTPC